MDKSSSRSFRRVVCVVLLTLLLGGCASKYGVQTTTVQYFPQCYSPVSELRRAESEYKSTVATGSVLGVLAGALGGYLATGNSKGAIVGAAAGGVAGTAVGYAQAESQQNANENRRLASYLSQLDGDISGLDTVSASARLSIQCYDKQFHEAMAAFKAGRMSKSELQARYAEIRSGSQEAANIMGQVVDSTLAKEKEYQQALAREAEKTNQPVPVIASAYRDDASNGTTTAAKQPTKQPVKKPVKKPAPSGKASNVTTSTPLEQMAERTQALSTSRQELQQETSEVASLQKSWAADLAAIES